MENKQIIGEELFASGKIEEARLFFIDLLNQDPSNCEIINNLGVIHFTLEDYNAAENYFLEALAIRDDNKDAFSNLVELYHSIGRWKKSDIEINAFSSAISFFSEKHKSTPESPLFPFIIGFLLFKKGKYKEAREAFIEALNLKPDFYKATYYLGLLNTSEKKFDEAQKLFTACLEINPSFEPAALAMEECHNLREQHNKRKLRIFAAYAKTSWNEYNIEATLIKLGEVLSYTWDPDFNLNDPEWHTISRQKMNVDIFEQVQKYHTEKPIDVFFSCLSGRLISSGIIRAITLMGIPTFNFALEDHSNFFGDLEPTGFSGSVDIANAFTLNWTMAEKTLENYRQAGARAIFMPPGANPDLCRSRNLVRDIDVLFIGQKKDIRPVIVDYLLTNNINIKTYGSGWEADNISVENAIDLINRSKISLAIRPSEDNFKQVEYISSCFEITMCGGFLVAEHCNELEKAFIEGKEIILYNTLPDLLEKIRFYLAHPGETEEIRKAGRAKSIKEHTWEKRFNSGFEEMGIKTSGPEQNRTEPLNQFDIIQNRYNTAMEKLSLTEFPRLKTYVEEILAAFPKEKSFEIPPFASVNNSGSIKTDNEEKKKNVLFLSVFPRVDMAKKADALVKTGKYRTKLLCAKMEFGESLEYMKQFYEELYTFSTWQELLCYLIEFTPDVIISRPRDQIAALAIIFGNAPVIFNLYDLITNVSTVNMLAVEAEQFCFLNADGVMHKLRPDAINKYVRPVCKVRAPVLHFYPYCWDRYIVPENTKKLSEKDGIPRLVYTGIVAPSNTDKYFQGPNQMAPIIKAITDQNIYFSIYYNPETGVRDGYYQEYFDLAKTNPFFSFNSPLPTEELNNEISKYDYGVMIHDIRDTLMGESKTERNIATANKIFTYLEAGLPIISGNSHMAVADFVEEHRIGIVVDATDLSGLSNTLQSIDYKELKRNVIKTRNDLSLDKNIYKLDKFIESLLQ